MEAVAIAALSWHLLGGTEANQEKFQSGGLMSQPRFEPGVSRIQVISITTFVRCNPS
jgi:hypothetical protein